MTGVEHASQLWVAVGLGRGGRGVEGRKEAREEVGAQQYFTLVLALTDVPMRRGTCRQNKRKSDAP